MKLALRGKTIFIIKKQLVIKLFQSFSKSVTLFMEGVVRTYLQSEMSECKPCCSRIPNPEIKNFELVERFNLDTVLLASCTLVLR